MTIYDLNQIYIAEIYSRLAPRDASIVGVQIKNSTYDSIFCENVFKTIANGKKVIQKTVKGNLIGSTVCGGAQEYVLFFC